MDLRGHTRKLISAALIEFLNLSIFLLCTLIFIFKSRFFIVGHLINSCLKSLLSFCILHSLN